MGKRQHLLYVSVHLVQLQTSIAEGWMGHFLLHPEPGNKIRKLCKNGVNHTPTPSDSGFSCINEMILTDTEALCKTLTTEHDGQILAPHIITPSNKQSQNQRQCFPLLSF